MRHFVLAAGLSLSLASACGGRDASGPPNVLLVVLDTTRADAVSVAEDDPVTPAFAALARDGVVFVNARSTAAWTLPSHASLFTGLYPSSHGAHHESQVLPRKASALAELLAPAYATAGFSENPHIGFRKGFAQGFEHFEETWRSARMRRTAARTVERATSWLDAREESDARPFFLFVNLMDPHLPYSPPAEIARRVLPADVDPGRARELARVGEREARQVITGIRSFTAEDLALLRALYRAEVATVDAKLGSLVAHLRERGALDRTLVVVVGDHGENIGEHGLMEHQLCLYETLLRVPLLLRLPGVFDGGSRRQDPVQLVDVAPTVLDVAGVPEAERPPMQGRSLLDGAVEADRPVLAEYMRPDSQRPLFRDADPGFAFDRFDRRLRSIQVGALKLILPSRGEPELYDLASDPGEAHDLAAARPEDVARLRAGLAERLPDLPAARESGPASAPPALDDETREALRELGYGS